MKRFVKIISNDSRFVKMLYLELADYGIISGDRSDSNDPTDEFYIIADLDQVTAEELADYNQFNTVFGFTKNDSNAFGSKSELCASVFTRPFLTSELLALFYNGGVQKNPNLKPLRREDHKKSLLLTVDPTTNSALWGDVRIPLSEYECQVLSLLCENRGEIVERDRISALLKAEEGNMGDVYICHLRRKIDNKLGLKLIYTIRGEGYMLKN